MSYISAVFRGEVLYHKLLTIDATRKIEYDIMLT